MSFLSAFFGIVEGEGEHQVLCPFPHTIPNTDAEYLEQHPSAHVNTSNHMFHCKACGRGYTELQFITELLGCTYAASLRLARTFNTDEDLLQWRQLPLKPETVAQLKQWTITDDVIQQLHIRTGPQGQIAFPVLMYDTVLDIRSYTPDSRPKMMSRKGSVSRQVIPFDLWKNSSENRVTLVCAGEKDMAVARSHGFNAITITGGESAVPLYLKPFEGRKVVIVYDNDVAGQMGARRLATALHGTCASVSICDQFHEVCKNPKEDITDFFVKYGKSRADLIYYLQQVEEFVPSEAELNEHIPLMPLYTATQPQNIGRLRRSNIQVVAVSEAAYMAPSVLTGEKYRASDDGKDTMKKGETVEWELSEHTAQDLLHMMDNNFTEEQLYKNYKTVIKIPKNERYIRFKVPLKETIYKAYVTDLFETASDELMPMEYVAYSIGTKLESGKKYQATYKLVPHPYKGQQLTMMITEVSKASDSVTNFVLTDNVKAQLKIFQNLEGTVEERMWTISERFKGLLQYDGINILINVLDLGFHTALEFNFGKQRNIRGYLDTLIVGESRMGKSSTAETMRRVYNLGTFVSLAGNAATIPGLVGGSNKTAGGAYQTRAGIIPQNHRGMIIFEELGKSNANVLTELTDIRSSNEVRITRVSGTLTLPAMVRMVALSNVKNTDGVIKPIASYPHGIGVLTELVGTAEDIARYDLLCILPDRGNLKVDPLWEPQEPFPEEAYQARIRWVWSRTADQIKISHDVAKYIIQQANELNEMYDCHIKIFGTEAWKKLSRLAIAAAGCLVSTDDTCENLIVLPEHVDYAVHLLQQLYDNPTFKLREYVEHERRYSQIDDDGIALLQNIYTKSPAMLQHLESVNTTSKNALQAATGLTNDEYNAVMNQLISGMFVVFSKYEVIPTERFRKGVALIERKHARLRKLGERV